jgi:hypothetical protein
LNTRPELEQAQRRRKGQTLAEFAITLPILLILTFGVIEFGRIFQAWVTLQNAARAGARYASTGQYDEARFVMDLEFKDELLPDGTAELNDATGFIPCVDDGTEPNRQYGTTDQRGTIVTIHPNGGGASDAVQVYDGKLESVFATWNFGKNCDPRDTADQDRRKDMARILSIMEEARKGAGGLFLEANTLPSSSDPNHITNWPWFEVWKVPFATESNKAWFNVTVCSTRRMLDQTNSTNYYDRIDPTTGNAVAATSRFVTYLGDTTLRNPSGSDLSTQTSSNPRLPSVGCMLNENMGSTTGGLLNNAGKPWMDPGGPSDTVTVIVTFNHPLVTPLGLAPYIRMQARRSAIVESFRAADPQNAFSEGGGNEQNLPTNTLPPTDTPRPTDTPTATGTTTPLPSPTPTKTVPPPFTCSLITINPVENANFDGLFNNTVAFEVQNDNVQSTFLTRVIVKWPTIQDYPSMYMAELALNSAPHWKGRDASDPNAPTNTTDTNTDSSTPANYFVSTSEQDRTIGGQDTGIWTGEFSNGPQLQDYVNISQFSGTTFYLNNPLTPGVPCQIQFTRPVQPTPTRNPASGTVTPTFTPDCVGPLISVQFGRFEQFGIVRLDVYNNRSVVSGLTNFNIQWRQRLPGVLTLDRVTVVAPPGVNGSVEVWRSSGPTQDSTPPTGGKTEGTWVQNFTFPANSVTSVYLDFGGWAGTLNDLALGVVPSDFNGTQFMIGCGGPGGTGPGGPNNGVINLANQPTPGPTSPPGPSNTPRPTLPPTPIPTKGPPTAVPTAGPTSPPRPTNTPLPPPPTATKKPPPTLPGGGCVDGCG